MILLASLCDFGPLRRRSGTSIAVMVESLSDV